MKLAIDFGNTNIKAATIDGKGKIKTCVIKSLATTDSVDATHVVTCNGLTVHFGVGDTLAENDKTDRKFLEHTILLMAHNLGLNGSTEIAVGLPLKDYKSESRLILSGIIGNLKTISGIVNGEAIKLTVTNSLVCAEGHAVYVSCMDDIKETPCLILDIGYRTLDVIGLKKEQGKLKLDGYTTVNKGLYDVYTEISKSLPRGVGMDRERVENALENDPTFRSLSGKHNINDFVCNAKPCIDSMIKEVMLKFQDYNSRMIYVAGGGAELITPLLDTPNKEMIGDKEKSLYANVVGYLWQMR